MAHRRNGRFSSSMDEHVSPSHAVESPQCRKIKKKTAKKRKENSSNKLWSWGPLRAITRILQQQFPCVFSIFVQAIDYLPSSLEGLRLVVQCLRREKQWQTMPSRVYHGVAEFEEAFHIPTTIYGRKVSSHGNAALKFMPKELFLSVLALDTGQRFLLDHRIDLSRIIPQSLKDFWEPNKPMCSTTSFLLSGEAEGAILVVTIDFDILIKDARRSEEGYSSARFGGSPLKQALRAFKSLPNSPNGSPFVRRSNYHFTSPCSSFDSSDGLNLERLDINSSIEETEDWSLEDYSSSDEERFMALKNDPLSLDGCICTDPAAPSMPYKSRESFGTRGNSMELHSVADIEIIMNNSSNEETMDLPHDCLGIQQSEKQKAGFELIAPYAVKPFILDERHNDIKTGVGDDFSFYIGPGRNDDFGATHHCSNNDMHLKTIFPQNMSKGDSSRCRTDVFSTLNHHGEGSGFLDAEAPTDLEEQKVTETCQLETETIEKYELPKQDVSSVHSIKREQEHSTGCTLKVLVDVLPSAHIEGHKKITKALLSFSSTRTQEVEMIEDAISASNLKETSVKSTGHLWTYEDDLKAGSQMELECMKGIQSSAGISDGLYYDAFPTEKEHDILSLEADTVAEDFLIFLEKGETEGSRFEDKANGIKENLFVQEHQPCPRHSCRSPLLNSSDSTVSLEEAECITELLTFIEVGEMEMKKAAQTVRSKARAKMMEDAETEALMKKWGLTDKAFESSSPKSRSRRLSLQLPGGVTVTPVTRLRDGGTLRSMNSDHFQGCNHLVMHVSKPVVLPARKGSCVLDILRSMASKGLENMTLQACLAMPLENLAGLNMEQAIEGKLNESDDNFNTTDSGSSETTSWSSSPIRYQSCLGTFEDSMALGDKRQSNTLCNVYEFRGKDELVSLEDFTQVALKRIEALALEALEIQCDMAKEAPASLMTISQDDTNESQDYLSWPKIELANSSSLYLHEKAHDDEPHPIAGCLLDKTIPLEEWILGTLRPHKVEPKTDVQRTFSAESYTSECKEVPCTSREDQRKWNNFDLTHNLMWESCSDSLTVAMRLQLRDPQCCYEAVGASLMAFVQAERVIPTYETIVAMGEGRGSGDLHAITQHKDRPEVLDRAHKDKFQFKITGVHVSGLQLADQSKRGWGCQEHLQLGAQWLLTNFKAKSVHMPGLKPAKSIGGTGGVLWSVSTCVQTPSTSWREAADFCPHIRNADLVFCQ